MHHRSINALSFSTCGCGTSRTSKTYLRGSGNASGSVNFRMPMTEPPATSHRCGRTYPRNLTRAVRGTRRSKVRPRKPRLRWSGSSGEPVGSPGEQSTVSGAPAITAELRFGMRDSLAVAQEAENTCSILQVCREIILSGAAGTADDARNLTPNPFPSGKGNQIDMRGRLRGRGDAIDHCGDLAALGVAGEAGCCDSLHVLAHCEPDELRGGDAALIHLRLFESAAADDDHRLE